MSQSQKPHSEKEKKDSIASLKNTALNKTADFIVKRREKKAEAKVVKDGKYVDGSVQEYIPVKTIEDGVVITTDGRYLSILEFSPIDFRKKNEEKQAEICSRFARIFRNGPIKAQIIILTDRYSPDKFLKRIDAMNAGETDPERIQSILDYKQKIVSEAESSSIVKRFLFIIEYEKDSSGKRSYKREEIIATMKERRAMLETQLYSMGNFVLNSESNNAATGEILYYFFNRKTSRRQNFESRCERMSKDFKEYSKLTGLNKKAEVVDAIAPKGIYFDATWYVFQDGQYYTYLGIKADGWCRNVSNGWVESLSGNSSNIDTTVIFQKLPREISRKVITQSNNLRHQRIWEKQSHGKTDKAMVELTKYNNNAAVLQALASGDDLYNVNIILTLRADSPKELQLLRDRLVHAYKEMLSFEDSWLSVEDYYRATMPLLVTPKMLLTRLNKNMVSSQIGSMYPFIGFELNDMDGYMLGQDLDSKSLVIINNFSSRFNNGHTLILGTSGAGKSMTEKIIGSRSSLNDMRVTCICPVKGFEYKPMCTSYDGTYVDLIPSSKSCLNPLAIRPEGAATEDSNLDEASKLLCSASLLSKKIATLLVWFKLNLYGNGERDSSNAMTMVETNLMSALLTDLYAKFGITGNNESIFEADGSIKTMPIIEDWYYAIKKHPELKKLSYVLLPYVGGGIASNLNAQTNVDLSKAVTVYNVDSEIIPEELLPAYIYLAFSNSYERIKENVQVRDTLILDEVWKMMKVKECAEQVQSAIKLMRSYYANCLLATQEIKDFFGSTGEFGRSILSNTDFKFFMALKEDELDVITEKYRLTEEDMENIKSFGKGQGLLIAGSNKVKIKVGVNPSERELDLYNTDRSKKKK